MSRRSSAADLPLLRWGEDLRRATFARRSLRRKLIGVGCGAGLLLSTVILPPAPRLVWNASASAPVGLYYVTPGVNVDVGDMVIARVPRDVRPMAAARGYIPVKVPLVKRVVAVAGDTVCATGRYIVVDSARVAERKNLDRHGRPMPWWNGCRTLRQGAVLLLMTASPDSFDGRYFGPTRREDIIGRAHLLWAA